MATAGGERKHASLVAGSHLEPAGAVAEKVGALLASDAEQTSGVERGVLHLAFAHGRACGDGVGGETGVEPSLLGTPGGFGRGVGRRIAQHGGVEREIERRLQIPAHLGTLERAERSARNSETGARDQSLDARLVRRDRPRSLRAGRSRPLLVQQLEDPVGVGLADRGRAGRDANDSALRAGHRAQVLAVTLREHHLDVLRVAAARSAVERLGDLAVVEHDLAAGLGHRAIRQRVFRAHSAVSLAARRRAEVEAFVDEATELAHGVSARRHRLRLERIQAVVELGTHLDRHHAAQIVLERQLVDQIEQPAIVEIDQDASAKSPALEQHARLRVGLDHQPTTLRLARDARRAVREHQSGVLESAALDGDPGAVDALIDQAVGETIGGVARLEAAESHAIQRRGDVEAHLRRRAGRAFERARQRPRLILVLEGRRLQLVDRLFRFTARRHLEAAVDRAPRPAVLDPHPLAARYRDATEIGLETDADDDRSGGAAIGGRQGGAGEVARLRRDGGDAQRRDDRQHETREQPTGSALTPDADGRAPPCGSP